MSDGYGSTGATTTWISSDGTVTNYDPNTEMGFWISALHNECDRSAHLEREIERLRLESLQLQGLVRAHEGMYVRAAEQIDQQRNWLERLYRLTVGHGPNWGVFDSWEDAITAYEETRHG